MAFSLSLFFHAGRNISEEIENCRGDFDDRLDEVFQTCENHRYLRSTFDSRKCLHQMRKAELVGASCFNREQRFHHSAEWYTAAIVTLIHCGALPLLVSLIIWLSQHSFRICNLKAFLKFPHSLPAMIYQFHYTRKLIGNYAKDRIGDYNKWFFEVNKTKWLEKLKNNESLLNLAHMIEATIDSSFQFWFQTIYAFPTIILTFADNNRHRWNMNEFVNIRLISILFSFGTFAFTFYNIR